MTRLDRLVFPINSLPAAQFVEEGVDRLCWDFEVKTRAVERYCETVDPDLLFYFADIVLQAEALGARTSYPKDDVPSVREPAAVVPEAGSNLISDRMRINSRLIKRLRRRFPDKPVAAVVHGPFTVAGQVQGEEKALRDLIREPSHLLGLVQKALDGATQYARCLLDAGASVLWLSDPLASLLSPARFPAFAGEPLACLLEAAKPLPTVLHVCGDTSLLVGELLDTGARGISFDQCMNLELISADFPVSVNLIGNVGPLNPMVFGGEKEVRTAVEALAGKMSGHVNYVLSTGCALPLQTPIPNILAFMEAGRRAMSGLQL